MEAPARPGILVPAYGPSVPAGPTVVVDACEPVVPQISTVRRRIESVGNRARHLALRWSLPKCDTPWLPGIPILWPSLRSIGLVHESPLGNDGSNAVHVGACLASLVWSSDAGADAEREPWDASVVIAGPYEGERPAALEPRVPVSHLSIVSSTAARVLLGHPETPPPARGLALIVCDSIAFLSSEPAHIVMSCITRIRVEGIRAGVYVIARRVQPDLRASPALVEVALKTLYASEIVLPRAHLAGTGDLLAAAGRAGCSAAYISDMTCASMDEAVAAIARHGTWIRRFGACIVLTPPEVAAGFSLSPSVLWGRLANAGCAHLGRVILEFWDQAGRRLVARRTFHLPIEPEPVDSPPSLASTSSNASPSPLPLPLLPGAPTDAFYPDPVAV